MKESINARNVNIIIGIITIFIFAYELIYMLQVGIESIYNESTSISIKILSDLAEGNNPYGTAWLYDNSSLPVTYWESGFFHILPSLLLIKLFHLAPITSTVVVHIAYVIIAMVLIFAIVNKITGLVSIAIFASNILFVCINPTYVNGIRPDTLCVLLILLITYVTLCEKLKNSTKEWIIAIACILLLFLKIHYASVIVAVYIVSFKKKRWIQLSIKNAVIGTILCIATVVFFPTFFSTFGIRVIQMFTSNNSNGDYTYMVYQWKELFVRYFPLFILLMLGSLLSIKRIKYICEKDIYLFLFSNIVVNILGLCYMGKWSGNFLAYHNVMIMPMIIIGSMVYLSKLTCNKNVSGKLLAIIMVLFTLGLLMHFNSSYRIHKPSTVPCEHSYNEWIENNRDNEMLLSSSCAQFAYDNDYYLWDWGDQIYLPYDIGTSPKWNALFPYTNLYRNKNIEYANTALTKIKNQEYSLIVSDDYNEFGHKIGMKDDFWNAIQDNYELMEKDDLVGYWVPKGGQ